MRQTTGESDRKTADEVPVRHRGRNGVGGIAAIFALMYFLQSLGDPGSGIIAQPVRSLLKRWGESPGEIALFMAIIGLPWAIKPLFGLVSDFLPLLGSRRRIYLILAMLSSCAGFAVIAGAPLVAEQRWVLLAMLLMPAVGVAFGDVLIDALMVSEGQPRGLTGVLQSVQWTAAYAAMLLTGLIGGYFSHIERPDLAFGLCAVLWGVGLLLVIITVREPRHAHTMGLLETLDTIRTVLRNPGLLPVAAILFVLNFNPLWETVLYLHLTGTRGFPELAYGRTVSVFSGGAMAASALYPLYCRRVNLGRLIHLSIVMGMLANLVYCFVFNEAAAYAVAFLGGLAYMTGTMIQLDIAARRVPLVAAATVFALLMGLANLASSLSEAFGGNAYELLVELVPPTAAYQFIVTLSAVIPALCWLILPHLKRQLPDWFGIASRGPHRQAERADGQV